MPSPLAELADVAQAPPGFRAQLVSDSDTYTFSIKDTLHGCQFVLFSDQSGLIYTGAPIQ